MKKGFIMSLIISIIVCFFAPVFPVKAVSTYQVYLETESGSSLLSSFATYKEAHTLALSKEKENQNYNLIIYDNNGKIKYVTYGLVNFNIKGDATTTYTIEFNNLSGYNNGAYGADAAFLGTNEDGTKIRFKQAGVIGWVNANEVELINMNATNYKKFYTSCYIMEFSDVWELRHNITSDVRQYSKGSKIILGQERPSGMKDKTYYLSYDGHYFYPESFEGYRTMIRDYKAGVYTSAINAKNPYYNYYQFVSHRSITNYTQENIRQDLSAYTAKPKSYPAASNESQLYGEETSFIQYQNEYGANAILMLGVAKNESGMGQSNISINKNNLFGHSAYDSSPGASANGYVSVAQGIYAHAKIFISEGYLDPLDVQGRYYGGNVGDKSSGMNVKYASDPYWGEKAAQHYYYFDKKFGLQDFRKYGIGVKTTTTSAPIKANPTTSAKTLYSTGPSNNYTVTILSSIKGEAINGNDTWYKIQTDATLNSTRTGIVQDQGNYNFDHNIGYIHSSYLSYVQLGKAEKKRYTIKFNPNGGKFSDNITATKSLTVEEYVIPTINPPSKEGYRFVGWDKEVVGATENTTYTAVYTPLVQSYTITFNAADGAFSDGSKTKNVTTSAGVVPNIEAPSKTGYTFIGWDPELTPATKNTTYTARYQKNGEIDWKETTGEFYFHELTSNKDGIYIKGYSTIDGIQSNSSTQVSYEIQFENVDTGEQTTIPLNRIMDKKEMPFELTSINGYVATYSWFDGTISLKNLKAGNYRASIIAKSGQLYTKKIVRNLLGKTMIGNYEQDGKQMWIRNNYYLKTVPMEFFVREQKVGEKNHNPIDNMITGYSSLSFAGNELKIRGFAHNVGGNYGVNASVSRTLILENTKTYETTKQAITTITNGDYPISLRVPDGFDKTKAWFEGSIDVSKLEKGTYVIYIANIANINDFAELNDIFGKPISASTSIGGKKYTLKVNTDARYRIELLVS